MLRPLARRARLKVVQRGNEPLFMPVMPWEQGPSPGSDWAWTQLPAIGATNGLQPLGNDTFIAWACASDAVVEAFLLRVSIWSNRGTKPVIAHLR